MSFFLSFVLSFLFFPFSSFNIFCLFFFLTHAVQIVAADAEHQVDKRACLAGFSRVILRILHAVLARGVTVKELGQARRVRGAIQNALKHLKSVFRACRAGEEDRGQQIAHVVDLRGAAVDAPLRLKARLQWQ